MPNSDRPRSPFAGMVDFSVRPAIRVLSPGEVEQRLAAHRLYLQTERRQGRRANFASTDLSAANLRGAGFREARLDEADLRDARLGGAFLVGASLCGADLRGAYLRLAKFDGADLSNANLSGTVGLTQAQLAQAHCNSSTKLPDGLIGRQDAKE